jgi:hypothetical protein
VGGLLALVLLVATFLSASHALHQSLHDDAAGNGHFCLLCSFAKGQVSAAAVALFSVALVACCLWCVCPANTSFSPGLDYRLAPSRAPPRS